MDHQLLLVAGAALAIMIAASVLSRRMGVATPLLLVGLGIGASYLPNAPTLHIEPELILAGVLPPLLYASAVHLPVLDVRRNLSMIAWLSVVLVIGSALAIGAVVHALFPSIPFALAVALGAVVSPTDAVAATAIGHRLGLPPRLMAVLEGESLANDATALAVLRPAVATLAATAHFSLADTVLDIVWAVTGALGVGIVIGMVTVVLRQRLDDPVLNTTISFAVPFLAYFPAEELGASGVLAVVAAGLVTGAQGSVRFSARDRQTQATTWTTVSFILESGVFLAMGYQLPELVDDARSETTAAEMAALVAVVTILLIGVRFLSLAWPALIATFGSGIRDQQARDRLSQFEERLDAVTPSDPREENRLAWARRRLARGQADREFEQREPITRRGLLVLAWAGMRGVVTVAAAQTIPLGTPHRSTVVLAAFFVALITLVLCGLTLPLLITRMRFESESDEERLDAVESLLRRIGEAAIDAVGPLDRQTVDGQPIDPEVAERMAHVLPRLVANGRYVRDTRPDAREQSAVLERRYLDAMRDALDGERSIGAFSSQTYRQVEGLVDAMEQRFRVT